MATNMGYECDMASSGEELLREEPSVAGRLTTRRRTFTMLAGILAMCAAVSLWTHPSVLGQMKAGLLIGLDDTDAADEVSCDDLPFVKLEEVVSSNLGKQGPDNDADEGIIYKATATNTGAEVTNIEIHVHSLKAFNVTEENDDSYDKTYVPAFKTGPFVNGIHGKFACINVKQGTYMKLRAHAYDPEAKEDIELPHGAISFFDLDTGKDNNHSVERVKIGGYSSYWLSNETQINVSHDHDSGLTAFTATKEGTGDDNPTDPVELTDLQKDKAVTVQFEGKNHIDFEIGASPGMTARVFSFVFRPSLLCAKTKMNQHLYPATGPTAPIVPRQSGAPSKELPSLIFMSVIAAMFVH